MFLLASGPSFSSSLRRPAVALTAIGEHDRNCSGTLVTASSRSTSKLFAAPSTSVPYELRPEPPSFFSVILNKTSSSSSGAEPQLLNLYTCMREPVLPASIIKAYWTKGLFLELDFEHFVVPSEGSITFSVPIVSV